MHRLLILSCSKHKNRARQPLPALDLYDGPCFRVLRRAIDQGIPLPTTFIVSAKYGLLPASQTIEYYDQVMTWQRAGELSESLHHKIQSIKADYGPFECALVVSGSLYRRALGENLHIKLDCETIYAPGPPGRQSATLYDWLYGNIQRNYAPISVNGGVRFLGKYLTLQYADVIRIALDLSASDPSASFFHSWYVPIDKTCVGAKWLVSKLTGVSVSKFRSADAVRLLRQLGVEVRRA